jgi:hypothetical protein
MNLYGSHRALLANATAALAAAVEVYNRPRMQYRDECFTILLTNAWELLLKAMLSRRRIRIYYPKQRMHPYRTLSLRDALAAVEPLFPPAIDCRPTSQNIHLLASYRDNCIHFYNSRDFGVLIYALAQTAVVNFRDLVAEFFGRSIDREISLSLLPLGIAPPVDPVQFLRHTQNARRSRAVAEYTQRVRDMVTELDGAGRDTGRLLTMFSVNLVSTKKVTAADFVVGVQGTPDTGGALLVQRVTDPNITHPLREVDIIGRKGDTQRPGLGITIRGRGQVLNQYTFRAIVYRHAARDNPSYCWRDATGAVTRYSRTLVEFIRRLEPADVDAAVEAYREHLRRGRTD